MDIKGEYLNGTLKENVYMCQPKGYDNKLGRICKLVKTLYGLKQSGCEWNIELNNKLRLHGYTPLCADPCAYIRHFDGQIAIATVWVDDLLLFASSEKTMDVIKDTIHTEWQATDLEEPSKIVGIEVAKDDKTIKISQKLYIESILKREGLQWANQVSTPLDPNIPIEPNPDGNRGDRSNSYTQMLGALQFLANTTRPDIAYAVSRLASYTVNPSLQHISALKRILRYLSGTRDHGITYKNIQQDSPNSFIGYTDAAYANTDDLKSTSGYVFITQGGAITWRSKKQSMIAMLSTKAKYVALSEAAREASWLRQLFSELGFKQEEPTLIQGDNDGSIAMARNPQFHK